MTVGGSGPGRTLGRSLGERTSRNRAARVLEEVFMCLIESSGIRAELC